MRHQGLVWPAVHDAPILHDANLICAADGAQAVSDDDCRAPCQESVERLLYEHLGDSVYACRRLVEDDDARVDQGCGAMQISCRWPTERLTAPSSTFVS